MNYYHYDFVFWCFIWERIQYADWYEEPSLKCDFQTNNKQLNYQNWTWNGTLSEKQNEPIDWMSVRQRIKGIENNTLNEPKNNS